MVLEKALATWDAQRKRARVLLVLDVSGSMTTDAGNGQSRMELAKKAALQSLALFAPDSLVRDIDTKDSEIPVRVFTIAYGGRADLGVLQRISAASRAAAYDAGDPTTIDKVLVNVLSNF